MTSRFQAAVLVVIAAGCDTLGIGDADRTLIGCVNGVTVRLAAVASGA